MPATAAATADFADWVRPHWGHMLHFAQRLVGDAAAEDVVQEALAAAWRSRARFDADRGQPRSWLLTIVANKAKNHRHGVRAGDVTVDEARSAAATTVDSVVALDVAAALARLTERQRVAVSLHYYLGLTTAECGDVMGCSAGTVKSTLSDARHKLGQILGEDYA